MNRVLLLIIPNKQETFRQIPVLYVCVETRLGTSLWVHRHLNTLMYKPFSGISSEVTKVEESLLTRQRFVNHLIILRLNQIFV